MGTQYDEAKVEVAKTTGLSDIPVHGSNLVAGSVTAVKVAADVATQAELDAVETVLNEHKAESATIVIIKQNISILSISWVDDTVTSGFWYYAITDADVTAASIVDVNIQLADLENANDIKSVTQSFAGTYRLYADAQPAVNITADMRITNQIGGV